MPVSQPTILVKKADGTSVRLTMEEFKKYQANKQSNTPEKPVVDAVKPEKKVELAKIPANSEALTTSTPVSEIFVDEAKYRASKKLVVSALKELKKPEINTQRKQWNVEDNKPLLEEEMVEKTKMEGVGALPDKRENVYGKIIQSLKFPLADGLLGRLQSLITSRVKDIRTDEQVKEYAVRPVVQGGLGLSEMQGEELIKAITLQLGDGKTTGGRVFSSQENIIQKVYKQKEGDEVQARDLGEMQARIKNTNYGDVRPMLHDITRPLPPVVPEEKHTVSPVDELNSFSLRDFRRLSAQPEVAGQILQEKFTVLKGDSYLLYLQAVKAWYNSPLYQEYLTITEQAIKENKKLREVIALKGREGLQDAEFKALVEVNEHLDT